MSDLMVACRTNLTNRHWIEEFMMGGVKVDLLSQLLLNERDGK
jgi:hypothetical protein